MKDVAITALLIAGLILTPLGAKKNKGRVVGLGLGCGAIAGALLYVR